MYYKTERQKCTYDKIPKIRLHLWKGNSYNNYIMTRIESVILCFLWWELRTEENSLILRRRSSAVCAESMGGIRSLWHIRYYRCFLFHAQMEPALLCADELLQYLIWAGSGNWKGDRARRPGWDFAAASDSGESGKPRSWLSALQPLRIWDSRGFWILSEVRQPVLVWPADERGCWFYEKR